MLLISRQQIQYVQPKSNVRLNLLRLEAIPAAVDEELVPSSVGAGSGIRFVKGKQAVIERPANCLLILAAQEVLTRKLRASPGE